MAKGKTPRTETSANLGFGAVLRTMGIGIDDAMVAIERDNPRLKGILPKDFARPGLDEHRLGELIDLIGTIGIGDAVNRAQDVLDQVYEYFLTQFASEKGKNGGQYYTPSSNVRLIVAVPAAYNGHKDESS